MTDNKKQIIKKQTVIVKDDFFDDIVNGLKSPIEEKIEKQDADNSKVELGGQQLQRVQRSILPEINKAIKNGELIQTYVNETRTQYQQLKIQEIKDYIDATQENVKELEAIEEEAEDELEDVKNDRDGYFRKFISYMKTLWNVSMYAIRFYGFYSNVKGIFDKDKLKSTERMYGFNPSDYDFNKELEREKACKDFSKYLNSTFLERIKEFISPFMFEITKAIYGVTDTVFAMVNRKIWKFIAKQVANFLWEIAITAALTAIATALSVSGVGTGAGVLMYAGIAARIINITNKIAKFGKAMRGIYKTFTKGAKFVRALGKVTQKLNQLRKSRAVRNAGAGAMKILRRARRMPKKQRQEIISDVVDTAEKIAIADEVVEGALVLWDVLDVTKEDIQRFNSNMRRVSIAAGDTIIGGLEKIEQYIIQSDSRKDARTYVGKIYQRLSDKYGVNIQSIENTGFDFNVVGDFISNVNDSIRVPRINVPKPKQIGEEFKLEGFTINKTEGTVTFDMGNDKVFKFDENTHRRFKKINRIKDAPLKLKPNGKSLRYFNGVMSGVWLEFETRYSLPLGKKVRSSHPNAINIAYRAENAKNEDETTTLYFGIENILGIPLSNNINTQKRESGSVVSVVLKDLSDIVTPRNKWLSLEKKALSKLNEMAQKLKV